MKTKWIMAAGVAAAMAFTATVQAVPITGSINFNSGSVTFNSPNVATATAITAFGGGTVVNGDFGTAPTGSFAGTAGTSVTFIPTGFSFVPNGPVAVNPLWTFATGGLTYSFDLGSVASSLGVGGALNLAGNGILHITGFEDTAGTWSFSSTGTGPSTFGFVAGSAALPDGGMTVMLLGGALSGLALLRKKLA